MNQPRKPLKAVIINKSDSTGGAAVVSRRLMEALRSRGIDARMLVAEKLTDSPFIAEVASPLRLKAAFLAERLGIFAANGFDRSTLFKIDTASVGVGLTNHPWIKEADVICLNWINQGLLSLRGIRQLSRFGKPIVWTMHDMWCMTGVCHHAGSCVRFERQCGHCPLLGKFAGSRDISRSVWSDKSKLYDTAGIHFVAVSRWLAEKGRASSLLANQDLSVIHNAFDLRQEDIEEAALRRKQTRRDVTRIVFGAARLDDTVKGFPILIEATRALRQMSPDMASGMELVTFGNIRNPSLFSQLQIPHRHIGVVRGEDNIRKIYSDADIVVSTSLFETLPGTLVEGQAYGCIPVSLNRGGQGDIIDHLSSGYLAEWSDDTAIAGENIARGILWAATQDDSIRKVMAESVLSRFAASGIADAYIALFSRIRALD